MVVSSLGGGIPYLLLTLLPKIHEQISNYPRVVDKKLMIDQSEGTTTVHLVKQWVFMWLFIEAEMQWCQLNWDKSTSRVAEPSKSRKWIYYTNDKQCKFNQLGNIFSHKLSDFLLLLYSSTCLKRVLGSSVIWEFLSVVTQM